MVWKKRQARMGSSSVDQDFVKETLLGPAEVVKNLVCDFLQYISVDFIHQTTHDVLCGDSTGGMTSCIE